MWFHEPGEDLAINSGVEVLKLYSERLRSPDPIKHTQCDSKKKKP